ncbi:MAG: cyclic pyranopterin monophosphate synthase MoaC [Moraxellaceae bacterium]|nr:MAG: cyclic pyranopterin monophosphate synthase MoaC [Moraxellaceae bacterium]
MISNCLSHLDNQGNAHMVDVGDKPHTHRQASAQGFVRMQPNTLALIQQGGFAKGDVLAVARIAGIQAAKKCADLIPLCHPLLIHHVAVDIRLDEATSCAVISATAGLHGQTGVEMEALTAVSVAALTLYDMCKSVDKALVIDGIRLIAKTGGRSGDWFYTPIDDATA